jgi:glucokinase
LLILVFDVGGSHIAGALCQPETLALSARKSVSMDCHGPATAFYNAVETLIRDINPPQLDGLSFAFPGPFDYESGVSRLEHKFEALNNTNLRDALSSRVSLPPIRVQFVNDADAFLLGELSQLSATTGNAVGITLGTGVGSAFAVSGAIVRSGFGVPNGGEIWNIPWNGGIVEDVISTRAIQAAYEKRTGRKLSVREIAESSPENQDSVAVFQQFGATVGDVIASITREFHPDTIIFGGAISRSASLFLPQAAAKIGGTVQLKDSKLFEDAALYGAAVHWKEAILHAAQL